MHTKCTCCHQHISKQVIVVIYRCNIAVPMQDLANDVDDVEQRSWARLADWMKQRYHAECSAVSALHRLASQAAYDGQPLPYQLDLQVSLLLPFSCAALLLRCPLRCSNMMIAYCLP